MAAADLPGRECVGSDAQLERFAGGDFRVQVSVDAAAAQEINDELASSSSWYADALAGLPSGVQRVGGTAMRRRFYEVAVGVLAAAQAEHSAQQGA